MQDTMLESFFNWCADRKLAPFAQDTPSKYLDHLYTKMKNSFAQSKMNDASDTALEMSIIIQKWYRGY